MMRLKTFRFSPIQYYLSRVKNCAWNVEQRQTVEDNLIILKVQSWVESTRLIIVARANRICESERNKEMAEYTCVASSAGRRRRWTQCKRQIVLCICIDRTTHTLINRDRFSMFRSRNAVGRAPSRPWQRQFTLFLCGSSRGRASVYIRLRISPKFSSDQKSYANRVVCVRLTYWKMINTIAPKVNMVRDFCTICIASFRRQWLSTFDTPFGRLIFLFHNIHVIPGHSMIIIIHFATE